MDGPEQSVVTALPYCKYGPHVYILENPTVHVPVKLSAVWYAATTDCPTNPPQIIGLFIYTTTINNQVRNYAQEIRHQFASCQVEY